MTVGAEESLVGFGRALRARGLNVGTGRILSFSRAAAALEPLTRDGLYWAGRATLVSRPEDFDEYDRAFNAFFRDKQMDELLRKLFDFVGKTNVTDITWTDDAAELVGGSRQSDPTDDLEEVEQLRLVASDAEVLRHKSFDRMTDEERVRVHQLVRKLVVQLPRRAARRTRTTRAGRLDLRRTVRRSFKTHGEPFHRAWKRRGSHLRPLVLILDISGSMASYAGVLVQFGYAAAAAGRRVEVFCFGTRLTRLTAALRTTDPDEAMTRAAAELQDLSGGTRIGSSMKELLNRYGQTAALRGAVVVLCSDGLERGSPALLAQQMARLGRLTHRIIWVNPLAGDPRYQPLARGMAAAMPHIDVFLPGHNVASLEALASTVAF
jgi:uncharacterized protein with von Willebrand factor type A (vWA) domain